MNLEKFVVKEVDGIKVISEGVWISVKQTFELYELIYEDYDQYSREGMALFKLFVKKYKVYFYSAPRETFSEYQAIEEAKERGYEYVLMEDLS